MSLTPDTARSPATIFGRSRWLWPESHHWDLHNAYAQFRRGFDLAALPARAPLFITADQSYRLHVNGRFVARGPARGFQHRWPYDEIDLAPHLRLGRNLIAIRAHNPGFSNFQYVSQGFAGLLVAARWGDFELVSDSTWRACRQTSVSRDTVPSSSQLFPQEHIDLRLEAGDWTEPDFDDSAWLSPATRPWNGGPWFGLEARGIPLLAERPLAPRALLGTGDGPGALEPARLRDVVALRCAEDRSHRPAPADSSATTLLVPPSGVGTFRSHLLDFGRTVVGNLVLTVEGAQGGEIIDTHLGETIAPDTLVIDQGSTCSSHMAFGDRLICRAGTQTHRFYHHYGFRYLNLTVRHATAPLRVSVGLDWCGYPLLPKGAFSSSDPVLERIWSACAWTQQCCSLDAYVDTPWREQVQWWGDARVQAWNTFHLSGDARLLRRGIAQIAAQTTPDGLTYGHAPTMAHSCILPDFTLIWLLTLWDHYWQTGSTEAFLDHRDTVRRALGYFERQTDPRSGLVTHDERFWLFLDWAELHKTGAPALLNLWLLLALEKIAALHRLAGLANEASPLEAWAARLRSALATLLGPDGLLCDGLDTAGQLVSKKSIHSQVLGAAASIPGLDIETAERTLFLPYLRGELHAGAKPSAYWITYLFSALGSRGHGAEVVAFIRRHWAAMADYGSTWENFDPVRGAESRSHAWSAHPLYHLAQTVGGINQSAVAWSEIDFSPVFHGERASVTVPTPLGDIRAVWLREGDSVAVRLQLPAGVIARIRLPDREPLTASGEFSTTVSLPAVRHLP
jgi:alpha-L-rhamnosidase